VGKLIFSDVLTGTSSSSSLGDEYGETVSVLFDDHINFQGFIIFFLITLQYGWMNINRKDHWGAPVL